MDRAKDSSAAELQLRPIGVARTPLRDPVDAPRQPAAARDIEGVIELQSGQGFEFALEDLEPGQALWIVFWFHRSDSWRAKVRPPRGLKRRGVFATRSPHRPNPIGLSSVELLRVDGLSLHVRGVDLLDGTPVLDIKPFVPYTDALFTGGPGWLGAPEDVGPKMRVEFAPKAREQLDYLERELGISLERALCDKLEMGTAPHPYRRIRKERSGFLLAHKEWRVRFETEGDTAHVLSLGTGYRAKQLFGSAAPVLEPHRLFVARYGYPGHGERAPGDVADAVPTAGPSPSC
jgi:tRNA-Thr(GGU) m(6)t(6)A37 methyltransferase TsaA